MIILFLLLIAVICVIFIKIAFDKDMPGVCALLTIIGVIAGAIIVFLGLWAIDEACCYNEYYKGKMAEYQALVYKVENLEDTYSDDFGMRKAELINEVCEWNVEVTKNSALADNLWWGIIYPDWWKEIPLIDYNMIGE